MTINAITPIPVLDFTEQEMDDGDTTQFVIKMNQYMSKLQGWSNDVRANSLAMETQRQEMVAALEVAAGQSSNVYGIVSKMLNDTTLNLAPNDGSFLTYPTSYHAAPQRLYNESLNETERQFDFSAFGGLFTSSNGSNLIHTQASTTVSEAGRYWGQSPGSDSVEQTFIDAIVRITGASFVPNISPGFSIAEIASGSGTSGLSHLNHYRWFHTNNMATISANATYTFGFYYQPVNDDAFLGGSTQTEQALMSGLAGRTVFLDGVYLDGGSNYTKLNSNQVYYVGVAYRPVSHAYIATTTLPLLGALNAKHRVAHLRVGSGLFNPLPTVTPVASISGLEPSVYEV